MWVDVAVLGGISIALIAYAGALLRLAGMRRLDLVGWFWIGVGTFHGLGFAYAVWATSEGWNDPFWAQWLLRYSEFTWIYVGGIAILLLAVWMGAAIAAGLLRPFRRVQAAGPNLTPRVRARLHSFAWSLLALAILSYWIYARAYGGFARLLDVGPLIRTARFELLPVNPWSWLGRLASLAFFATFIFLGMAVLRRERSFKDRVVNGVGFCLSLTFSLFVLVTWVGRGDLVVYVTALVMGYGLYRFGMGVSGTLRAGVLGVVLFATLLLGAGTWLGRVPRETPVTNLLAIEVSARIVPFFVQADLGEFRWMKDLVVAPLYLLPGKVWSGVLGLDTASDQNTEAIMGARKGQEGVTGQIPVGIAAFSVMQAGVIGIGLIGLAWGALLCWLDRWCRGKLPPGIREIVYAAVILRVAIGSIIGGDPQLLIYNNIHLVVGLPLLNLLLRGRVSQEDRCYGYQ